MPPNIHDIENFTLLRQALDILEAPEAVQRGLYPDDLDPAVEMRALFRDAWAPVDRLFRPVLEPDFLVCLEALAAALEAAPVDWSKARELAKRAGDLQPSPRRGRPPRPWLDQLVRGPHHLLLRAQTKRAGGAATIDAEIDLS